MANKTQHNKKALLEALEKSMGIVTTACEEVGINRWTYYDYYNKDEDFKKKVDELAEVALDFAESKLYKNISDGKETSIIFYLKTKGKKRGYIESSHIDHTNDGEPFDIEVFIVNGKNKTKKKD